MTLSDNRSQVQWWATIVPGPGYAEQLKILLWNCFELQSLLIAMHSGDSCPRLNGASLCSILASTSLTVAFPGVPIFWLWCGITTLLTKPMGFRPSNSTYDQNTLKKLWQTTWKWKRGPFNSTPSPLVLSTDTLSRLLWGGHFLPCSRNTTTLKPMLCR